MAPRVRYLIAVLLILLGLSPTMSSVRAGSESENGSTKMIRSSPGAKGEEESIKTVRLSLVAKDEPEYALEYLFETPHMDQRRGNGALLYDTALTLMEGVKSDFSDFDERNVNKWLNMKPEEMPLKEVRETASRFDRVIHYAELASKCEYCRWEYPIREEGLACVMPKLAGFRTLTRVLALKVRLAATDGDVDEAMRLLRIGISMGRDVGDGPFLVQGLVGIAINAMMMKEVQQLIELAEAPNLYWALTSLPRPLVDMHLAMQVESAMLYVELPELRTLEKEVWSEDQALRFGRKVMALMSGESFGGEGGDGSILAKAEMLAGALMVYPEAKKNLVEEGMSAEKVEAMPPLQVILIYKHRQYRRVRDMQFKWCNVPYWQAREGFKRAQKVMDEYMGGSEIDAIANALMYTMPAIERVCMLRARAERDIAMLRCVEAIRIHAAQDEGKLPRSLGDISAVPVPLDPLYGRAFHYEVDGQSCVLESPVPEGGSPRDGLRYEITMKKASP